MSRQARFTSALVCACVTWLSSAAQTLQATDRNGDQGTKATTARTVWDGVYTNEQAERGRMQYKLSCASCHAEDLRGDSTSPSLVEESFAFQWGDTTVGDLFVRIRTLMPSDRPNSLSNQSYGDIVAFILQKNQFPSGGTELVAEPDALRQILITTRPESK